MCTTRISGWSLALVWALIEAPFSFLQEQAIPKLLIHEVFHVTTPQHKMLFLLPLSHPSCHHKKLEDTGLVSEHISLLHALNTAFLLAESEGQVGTKSETGRNLTPDQMQLMMEDPDHESLPFALDQEIVNSAALSVQGEVEQSFQDSGTEAHLIHPLISMVDTNSIWIGAWSTVWPSRAVSSRNSGLFLSTLQLEAYKQNRLFPEIVLCIQLHH